MLEPRVFVAPGVSTEPDPTPYGRHDVSSGAPEVNFGKSLTPKGMFFRQASSLRLWILNRVPSSTARNPEGRVL